MNLFERIDAAVRPGDRVIDIGAGLGGYHDRVAAKAGSWTMVDAHEPVVTGLRRRYPGATVVCSLALDYLRGQPDGAFDVALGIDVIEHMWEVEAHLCVRELQRVAKRVVLFIPEGSHPQSGHGGNPHQEHRSTWWPADIEAHGFTVERWPEFHNEPGKDRGAMFCTWARNEP